MRSFLDYKKAFDTCNWKYMLNIFKASGFGEDICRWITTFYKK